MAAEVKSPPVFAVPVDLPVDADRVRAVKADLLERGVKHCFAAYVDVHGIPKAKATPIEAFEKMCRGAELYTLGAVEGLGLAGPHEDECATVPDLDTGVVCPWKRTQAWFSADLYYHGERYACDPRYLLQKQLARALELGLTLNLGIEPEFYVFRQSDDGTLTPITTSRFRGPNACYDVNLTDESLAFLEPMTDALNELDWGLYSFDQECGRGQHEFDFGYADALTTADRFTFLRMLAKKVAQSIGAVASFMPKPFSDDFRSGAHFNMSLADAETGANRFDSEDDAETNGHPYSEHLSKLGQHFTAGLLAHAPAITAVTCPTYNSYQGLIAQGELADFSWAPVLIAHGRNNRSAMLRVPKNRQCVENRAVDMSVNPYLAAAISLAAGLDGIERELELGPPVNEDVYKLTRGQLRERGVEILPPTLLHALDAFEADPLTDAAFGPYKAVYLEHKREEWAQSFYRVSAEQRAERVDFI